MRILLRAAIAASSLASIGSADAGEGEGTVANSRFTEIPGELVQAPVQAVPWVATVQNRAAIHAYATGSDRRTWISPPIQNYLAR
jgi:hypothetical protein